MKTCTGKCKKNLLESEFNKNRSKSDGLNTICKQCSRDRSRQYYKDNKKTHIGIVGERNKRVRQKNSRWLSKYKHEHGCCISGCNENESCALDFHHIGKKKKLVSSLVRCGYSLERIKHEISQCVVICANCHRKLHAGIITIDICY